MNKILSLVLIILLIGITGLMGASFLLSREILIKNEKRQAASLDILSNHFSQKEKEDFSITFLAVGDIMLDRGVEYMVEQKGKGDFRFPFLKIKDYFKKADILFGNLESVISDKGYKVGSIYSFRAEPKAIEGLIYAGFDIVSVANNHTFDYTYEALEDNLKRLKEADIDYVGAGYNEKEAFALKIKEIKDTKIGFLAYTNLGPSSWRARERIPGLAWIKEDDIEKIKEDIKTAKKEVDILVISFHWGDEYSQNPNSFQTSFGQVCIEAGADLIIGHHPHVVQPIEKYQTTRCSAPPCNSSGIKQNGWIAYSLGNFVFDQGFSEETMKGLLLEVIIENKKIKEVNPKEIKISPHFQPYLNL